MLWGAWGGKVSWGRLQYLVQEVGAEYMYSCTSLCASLTMEKIPVAPLTADGLLFALTTPQREYALQRKVVTAPTQRLPMVKSAVRGQPVFLFDTDTRMLHGPFAAEGPGGMQVDLSSNRPVAQLSFRPIVRNFAPLPESAIGDLLSFDPGLDGQGRRRPSALIDGAIVGPLLWLYVLHHHGLYVSDEEEEVVPSAEYVECAAGTTVESSSEDSASRVVAVKLATFLQVREDHVVQGTSLGEFYSSLSSEAEGEEARGVVRCASENGCKKGVQSFVHKHRDLLCLKGTKHALSIGLAA